MHISKVKAGDVLIADDAFNCLTEGREVKVYQDGTGLYVPCCKGKHYLDGQTNAIGEVVGLYTPSEIKTQQTGAST